MILDEPCAALGLKESAQVLSYMERAREEGVSVIFITHNVHQVFAVADRFVVLSHGSSVGSFPKGEKTREEIAEMIVGEGAAASS